MIRYFLGHKDKGYDFKENCENCWFNNDGICENKKSYTNYGYKIIDLIIDKECFEISL